MKPFERNAQNLAASLSFYGKVEERSGVLLITSSVAYSVFNIALLESPVPDVEGEFVRRIRTAAAHFRGQGRPWSFWICEDYLPRRVARQIYEIFEDEGLSGIAESPGMEVPDLGAPRRHLAPLTYQRVGDERTRIDFTNLVCSSFHIPTAIARRVYLPEAAWGGKLKAWIGYDRDTAVTSAATVEAAGALGVYSVSTLPQYREHGFAEAVMRHAIDEARREGAAGPLVLQSSLAGYNLYRAMGFRKTTRFFVFATSESI